MPATFKVQPFSFDRVFTASAASRSSNVEELRLEVEHLELEVVRLKRELETALAVARADGFQAGLDHARTERDTAVLAAADAIQATLERLDDRFEETEATLSREAAEIALAAADHLAARALEIDAGTAIDAAIARALRQVKRGEPIQVRVHPDLLERIEGLVSERQSRDRRQLFLTVIADATLATGDARLSWEKGGMALDVEARREALTTELDALLPPQT